MEKDRKGIYKKALLLFFAVMAIFTVISRVTDSMTIPKVEVQKAEKGRIEYSLNGNGSIKATEKNTYLIPQGFLVEFCQEDGISVEEGEVLIQFQREHLDQRKEELETELRQAELQLKQAKLTQTGDEWIGAEEGAIKKLDQIQTEYNEAFAFKQLVTDEYNHDLAILNQDMEAARHEADQEREQIGEEAYKQRLEEVEESFSQQKEVLDIKISNADIQLSQASFSLSQAQEELETAKKQDEITRKNGKKSEQAAGYTVESIQLNVDILEKKLEEIEELITREGKIYAAKKGVFLNTAVTEEMITAGSEFISIGTGGFEFTAEMTKDTGGKITEGDVISIKSPGKEAVEVRITQILSTQNQEEEIIEEKMILKAEMTEETYVVNGYAAFSIKKESEEEYENMLPLTAIRQDNNGYYCLAIRKSESVLGEEIKAERISIILLDKDDTQAAVKGAIHPDTEIIITSEKDIHTGDRVRVKK